MTKNELYSALTSEGVKLPPINKISKPELEAKYAEVHPDNYQQDALEKMDADSAQGELVEDCPTPPMLYFNTAGWCDELGCSYYMGWYQARSWDEYNALKKYAMEG